MSIVTSAAPAAFIPPSIEFAKRKAKAFQHELERTGRTFALSEIQEAIARIYGHRDWFDLAQRLGKREATRSALDDDLEDSIVESRRGAHIALAERILGLTPKQASDVLSAVRICASSAVVARAGAGRVKLGAHPLRDIPEPGSGELMLTVRAAVRGVAQGELTHVAYTDKGPVRPMHILVAAYANSDRLYARFYENAPSAEQIASAMTAIQSALGERFSGFHVPGVDQRNYPLGAAAQLADVSIARHARGREGARLVAEAESFLCSLSSIVGQLFESFPTFEELGSMAEPGHPTVIPRRPHEWKSPNELRPSYEFIKSLAESVCIRRGRDPKEGKRLKEMAPAGARPNNHISASPLPDPVAAAEEAVIFTRRGAYEDQDVRQLAQLLPDAMRDDEEGRAAFSTLLSALAKLDLEVLSLTNEHWRGYVSVHHMVSDRLRKALGVGSKEAACVQRAVGAYMSQIMSIGQGARMRLYALAVRVHGIDGEAPTRINGIPAHIRVQEVLAESLGLDAHQFLIDPYFVSDYHKSGDPRGHLALGAYISRGGAAWRGGIQTPLPKQSLLSKPVNAVSMDREISLHCVVTSNRRPNRPQGMLPSWRSREELICALARATEKVNERLEKWGWSTRVEFTDLKTYDENCQTTQSVLASLPDDRKMH